MHRDPEESIESKRKFDLNALLDYFIPVKMQVQPDAHRRARMFMLSHAFGPFLGNVIPLYLHFILKIEMDYRFWVFFVSITVFWAYPIALRLTGAYQALSFLSIQNLTFCILWACYSYGGDVRLHVSQRELGNMAGGSRESINKILQNWHRQRLIDLGKASILIHDIDALSRLI